MYLKNIIQHQIIQFFRLSPSQIHLAVHPQRLNLGQDKKLLPLPRFLFFSGRFRNI